MPKISESAEFAEVVRDRIGNAQQDTATIDLIHNDEANTWSASVRPDSITENLLAPAVRDKLNAAPGGTGSSRPVVTTAAQIAGHVTAARDSAASTVTIDLGNDIPLAASLSIPTNLKINPNGKKFILSGAGEFIDEGKAFTDDVLKSNQVLFSGAAGVTLAMRSYRHHLKPITPIASYSAAANTITMAAAPANGSLVRYVASARVIPGLINGYEYKVSITSGNTFNLVSTGSTNIVDLGVDAGATGGERHYFVTDYHSLFYDDAADLVVKPNHGWIKNTRFGYHSDGGKILPDGIDSSKYYAAAVTPHTFKFAGDINGAPLPITAQSGFHTVSTAEVGIQDFYPGSTFYKSNHGLPNGTKVRYWTEDVAIAPFVPGNFYYIVQSVPADAGAPLGIASFMLSATPGANGTPITMTGTGVGVHQFTVCNVRWTGDDHPDFINGEIFGTGSESFQSKVSTASAALSGKRATIYVPSRPILGTQSAILGSHQTLGLEVGGNYPSSYNGAAATAPVMFCPNVKIECNFATIFTSSVAVREAIFNPFNNHEKMGEVIIRNFTIKGTRDEYAQINDSNVWVGNATSGFVENFRFINTRGYCVHLGGYGLDYNQCENYTVRNGYVEDVPNQQMFVQNAIGWEFSNMRHKHRHRLGIGALYDIEPNDGRVDLTRKGKIKNVVFDLDDEYNGENQIFQLIALNFAGNTGILGVEIENIKCYCKHGVLLAGITGQGVSDLTITNFETDPVRDNAVHILVGNDIRINNSQMPGTNPFLGIHSGSVLFEGVRDGYINNVSVGNTPGSVNRYVEREMLVIMGNSSGSKIELGYVIHSVNETTTPHAAGFQMITEVFKGGVIEYNNSDWTVTGGGGGVAYPGDRRFLTVAGTLPTISTITIPAANVNTATGAWTVGPHSYVTGARVFIESSAALPAHEAPETAKFRNTQLRTYYIIVVNGTTVKLAASYEDATAATPIPVVFTDQGTGNHSIYPVLKTKFANTQINNSDFETYSLAPNSKTRPYTRSKEGTSAMAFTAKSVSASFGASEAGKTFKNVGSLTILSDGTAFDGEIVRLYAAGGGTIKFIAGPEDNIYYDGAASGTYGETYSSVKGSYLEMVKDGKDWIVLKATGTWTQGKYEPSPFDINFALGGIASAQQGANPEYAINGSLSLPYWDAFKEPPVWWQLDLGAPRTFNEVNVYSVNDAVGGSAETGTFTAYGLVGFNIQTSDSPTGGWTTAETVSGNNQLKRVVTFPSVTARYIRLNVTAGVPTDGPYTRLVEFKVFRRP